MNLRSWDVVVAGGGVIGSSSAYFLAAEPAFDGRILVVERSPSYQQASTSPHLAVDDIVPDVGFRENGYLFLATRAGHGMLRQNHALQARLGADIEMLHAAALARRFPGLETADIAAGCHGRSGEGWLDPYGLLQAFKRKARALGVTYIEDEVVDVQADRGRITAVTCAASGRHACGALIDAAGAGAARVAAMAGIHDLPVHSRKRCIFVFDADGAGPDWPLIVDPTGVYFRPEGSSFICGVGPEPDPDCNDFEVDDTLFEEVIWPALAHRIPAFEALRQGAAWAGHYAYNTFDCNAIVGPHPETGNFYFANGFSGHGLQQSPAVGRYLSELITFGAARTLDLAALGYERIRAGRPIRESNVV